MYYLWISLEDSKGNIQNICDTNGKLVLGHCWRSGFSKCGLWFSSNSITQELEGNKSSDSDLLSKKLWGCGPEICVSLGFPGDSDPQVWELLLRLMAPVVKLLLKEHRGYIFWNMVFWFLHPCVLMISWNLLFDFLGPHPPHMEVPRLGVELGL